MARNEEGEFELILGNKQLLSVFFLMVLLLGLCFVGGYVLGRSAAPVLTATNEPPSEESKALVVASAAPTEEPAPAAAPVTAASSTPAPVAAPPPIRTAPQSETTAAKAAPPPTQTAPATAAKQAPAAKQPANGQPIPGRIYLQISATDKDKADIMADLLRRKNLPGIAAAITERPGLYRVLVGPLQENALADMKSQLKANGFPSDEAIRRVF